MKKLLCVLLSMLIACSVAACSAKEDETETSTSSVTAGEYTQRVVGHNADFDVTVVVAEDGSMTDIVIGENKETHFVGTYPMEQLREKMLENQTWNVDAVAGATISSYALRNGVKKGLEAAGVEVESMSEVKNIVEHTEDATTQLVVIGSGSAGLAATMEAVQNNIDVILVEQLGMIGGSSARAGYFGGGGTIAAANAGDSYSEEDFINMMVSSNPDQTELAQFLGENAGDSIDWLYNMGLDEINYDMTGMYGSGIHWGSEGPIGGYFCEMMVEQLEKNAVDVRLNTTAKTLIVEEGTVKGVSVENLDGSTYNIYADAVIMATGGFARGEELIKKYTPELTGLTSDASMGADGSGMLMAEAAGAALDNMSDVINYYGINVIYRGVPRNITYPYLMTGPVIVNLEGKRFIDETTYYLRSTVDAMLSQTDGKAYIILNQTQADQLFVPANDYTANDAAMYTKYESFDEMASDLGINLENLKETIANYNSYVENGADLEFNKASFALGTGYNEGPIYVAKVEPCTHMNYGGIRTDLGMHALNENDEVISGLYAAGECTHVIVNGLGTNTVSLVEGREAVRQYIKDYTK